MATALSQIAGEGSFDASIKKIINDNALLTADLSSVQTLANKTLTDPVISGPAGAANRVIKTAVFSLAGAALQAGVLAWQNPEAVAVIIQRSILHVRTVATGAGTVDIGVTPTSATTESDTLLDGIDVNAATGVFDSMNAALDAGANAKAQLVAAGKWVTAKSKTGDTTGMVAEVYIEYILAAA